MVQVWSLEEIPKAASTATFRIGASKNNPPDATMHNSASAHRTRLFGDVEVALREPPVFHGSLRLCESEHLRMSRCVLECFHLIPGTSYDSAFVNDDRADRDLILTRCLLGQP